MALLFSSLGIKRYIASLLAALVEVLRAVPGTAESISAIELAAGFFGITGLTHAAGAKTVSKKKLASAASVVSALLALSYFVPALLPLRPYLEKVAGLLGAAALGSAVAKPKEEEG